MATGSRPYAPAMADQGWGGQVGRQVGASGRQVVAAPLEDRMAWIWPFLGVVWTFNLLTLDWLPVVLRLVLTPVAWFVAVSMFTRSRSWSVTFDGEHVEVRGGRALWRFRRDDIASVVVPLAIQRAAIIRADRMERRMYGVPVPWPFPWRRAAPTYVRPEWFTSVVGVSPDRVRPGPIGRLVGHR